MQSDHTDLLKMQKDINKFMVVEKRQIANSKKRTNNNS